MKTYYLFFVKALLLFPIVQISGQNYISEEQAINTALQNHPQMNVSNLQVEQQKILKRQSVNIPNPELLWQAPTANFYTPGILIATENPVAYIQLAKTQNAQIALTEAEREIAKNDLVYGVRYTYNELQYLIERERLLQRQDSLFESLIKINEVRYRVGDINSLEKLNGETKYRTVHYELMQVRAQLKKAQRQLALYMGFPNDTTYFPNEKLKKLEAIETYDTTFYRSNPSHDFFMKQIEFNNRQVKLSRSRMYPGLVAGYLNQGQKESPVKYRFQFGITLPVFFWTYSSRINAAKKGVEISRGQYVLNNYKLNGAYAQAIADYKQYEQSLNYFETTGMLHSAKVMENATGSYKAGEIGYFAFLQTIDQAFSIEMSYLDAVKGYNQSVIYLNYLKGNK